ncbi:unnamed protein product [Rotaria sordida]|uniref:Uncharacterized protein n=1 Tax=Rotaria sordida TaxID=392033 RepID=A0A815JKD5_9BILA|nr:unnamed protein product [Rotaria sordida]CAF1382382.1 unnamed protein product [Rotaria sordida]
MTNLLHRLNSLASDPNFKLSCNILRSKLIPQEKSIIDLILTNNNPEQAEIILPDGRIFVWYFAIGSMINPISLYLRDLTPIISYPVICKDYKIVFRSPNGMADIEACLDAEFHGVVHLLTNEQMKHLDEIEFTYHRIKIKCIDYQGQYHTAYAYQMNIKGQLPSIPYERYLDIIVKGCEYYGVQSVYINRLKDEQPVIPRKKPANFQSFKDFLSDTYYSLDELQKHNGDDPSLPLWVSINGKILEYAGLPPNDHPDYEVQQKFYTFVKQKLGGREVTNIAAKGLYDPLYKIPLNDEDISDEHRAQIEDYYYDTLGNSQNKLYWKPIGRLRQPDDSS